MDAGAAAAEGLRRGVSQADSGDREEMESRRGRDRSLQSLWRALAVLRVAIGLEIGLARAGARKLHHGFWMGPAERRHARLFLSQAASGHFWGRHAAERGELRARVPPGFEYELCVRRGN